MKRENFERVKTILSLVATLVLGVAMVVFTFLYVDTVTEGFIQKYGIALKITSIIISLILIGICFFVVLNNHEMLFKICVLVLFFIVMALLLVYLLKISGFWKKINNIEDFRSYIAGFGAYAVIVFLIFQILQVVLLPIPGVVAIGAGVALFGVQLGAIYSLIGILIGTFVAYYIGKYPGEKVVAWIVGRENLDKTLKLVKGKDKIILTFMFLFPFFPDDVLCFVAGMSSMSQSYFIVMILITRVISVYTTAYSVNGSLIPYNTPWGIAIWTVLILGTIAIAFLIYKYGDKIEYKIKKLFKKQKNKE